VLLCLQANKTRQTCYLVMDRLSFILKAIKHQTWSDRAESIQPSDIHTVGVHHACLPLGNVFAKNCKNRTTRAQVTAENAEDTSLRHGVHVVCPRDAMLARYQLHGPVSLCVCVCVCVSLVSVLSKRMDGSSWFLAYRLPLTYAKCILRYCILDLSYKEMYLQQYCG